jgi:hypothetical protein
MTEHDQLQADLDAAVDHYFKAKGWDGFTSSWVMVAHQHKINPDSGLMDDSGHPIVYMGGSVPDHVALGLLQVGSDVIRCIGRWGRADEEEEN